MTGRKSGIFGGVLLIAALGLMLCGCGQNSEPEETASPLEQYEYSDIVGEYAGELTPGEYSLTGNWDAYLLSMEQSSEAFGTAISDVFSDYDGISCEVTATLSDNTLKLITDSDVFFGSIVLELTDFVITDGIASGECQRALYKSDGKVVYDVTLLAADDGGYRLVGTVTVSEWSDFPLGEETTELGYSCTASFDMVLTDK